jgi:hypothetical protein
VTCPDADLLCALVEDQLPPPERDAIMGHIVGCVACSTAVEALLSLDAQHLAGRDDWQRSIEVAGAAQSASTRRLHRHTDGD